MKKIGGVVDGDEVSSDLVGNDETKNAMVSGDEAGGSGGGDERCDKARHVEGWGAFDRVVAEAEPGNFHPLHEAFPSCSYLLLPHFLWFDFPILLYMLS